MKLIQWHFLLAFTIPFIDYRIFAVVVLLIEKFFFLKNGNNGKTVATELRPLGKVHPLNRAKIETEWQQENV